MSLQIGPQPIFVAVLLLTGLGLGAYGVYDYTQQSDVIRSASEVNATVTGTSVETVTSKRSQSFKPVVRFEYRYGGETHTSNRIFPTSTSPKYETRSRARSVVEEYESGETVTAYVTPDAPGRAFLTEQKSTYPLKLAGIGLAIVGLTTISVLRSRVRQ